MTAMVRSDAARALLESVTIAAKLMLAARHAALRTHFKAVSALHFRALLREASAYAEMQAKSILNVPALYNSILYSRASGYR